MLPSQDQALANLLDSNSGSGGVTISYQSEGSAPRSLEGASLFIPLFRPEPLRILIDCAAPERVEPSPVEVRLNVTTLKSFVPTTEMREQVMTAEAALWRRINVLEIVPVNPVKSPLLAVDRVRFVQLDP